tara:strand:+ start:46 stop:555 length:510 start_codon:yes stop_codon:yes gene_type:complete
MNANINVTMLACSLAKRELENHKDEFPNGEFCTYDKNGNSVYCDKAQDIFNEYLEHWEEQIMLCKVHKKETDKLKKELDWFRDFGWKVNQLSSSVNDKACKYADALQKIELPSGVEVKRLPQSDVDKYAEWILTQCDNSKDEITWLIQTILESDNAHCLDDTFDSMRYE